MSFFVELACSEDPRTPAINVASGLPRTPSQSMLVEGGMPQQTPISKTSINIDCEGVRGRKSCEGKKSKTCHMNGARYHELIKKKFAAWRRECFGDDLRVVLVQDHERCLWQDRNVKALRAAGCDVEWDFPPSSPDLNAIESWWCRLRSKLLESEPAEFEDRPRLHCGPEQRKNTPGVA